jgi:hypothetical protein
MLLLLTKKGKIFYNFLKNRNRNKYLRFRNTDYYKYGSAVIRTVLPYPDSIPGLRIWILKSVIDKNFFKPPKFPTMWSLNVHFSLEHDHFFYKVPCLSDTSFLSQTKEYAGSDLNAWICSGILYFYESFSSVKH